MDGKIYTVYIGSFELAKRMSSMIQDNIGQYLEEPLASEEIKFTKGVVGRFNGFMGKPLVNLWGDSSFPHDPFLQYGDIGINFLKSEIKALPNGFKGYGQYLIDNPNVTEKVWKKEL